MRPSDTPPEDLRLESVLAVARLISGILVLLLFVLVVVAILVVVLIVILVLIGVAVLVVVLVVLHDEASFHSPPKRFYIRNTRVVRYVYSIACHERKYATPPHESKYLYSICSKISFVVLMVTPRNRR